MSTVSLPQIFNIIDGPEDYINVNIAIGQCIATSLDKIDSVINYTDSPFLVDMITTDSADTDTTSLVEFTSRMNTVTDTFLTACNSAIQTTRSQKTSETQSYTYLTDTFHDAQTVFFNEYENYLKVYTFLFTTTSAPTFDSSATSVVDATMQGVTPRMNSNTYRPLYSTQWMLLGQLRIVNRVLQYLTSCYQTVTVLIAPTDAKYNSNSTYSSSVISSITSAFSTVIGQVTTITTEGSDLLDSFEDWEYLAREGSVDIETSQSEIITALTAFDTAVGTLQTNIDSLNTALEA
jgi:hypothetical protein